MMKPLFMVLLLSATKELMRKGSLCEASPCQSCSSYKESNLYVREGEMAVLKFRIPQVWRTEHNNGNVTLTWSNHSGPGRWVSGDTLVILRVSPNDEGSYSCSLIGASGQAVAMERFYIKVYSDKCYTDLAVYPTYCYEGESCYQLQCSEDNIPQNFTRLNYTWYKDCDTELDSSFENGYLSSADVKDSGNYTCMSYYVYNSHLSDGQVFRRSRTVERTVEPGSVPLVPKIISPKDGDYFEVDMGSPVVVVCRAVIEDPFANLFWLANKSFVEKDNDTLPVFYNSSKELGHEEASLVIKQVSEEHLNSNYTCKLQSPSGVVHVSITLKQKRPAPFPILVFGVVGVFVVTAVVVTVVYVQLKVDIVLFLRDDLGLHRHNSSDGKCYDAYVLCCKSNTGSGVSEEDRRKIEAVLEEEYGYSLCLFDRDILPGEAVSEAVLASIEKSRRLILVSSGSALNPGQDSQYSLLTGLHAALVERQTPLVLVQAEVRSDAGSSQDNQENLKLDSVPEAQQKLVQSGHKVTWKGSNSEPLSSAFWKELRYHMPARARESSQGVEKALLRL
uniref:Interleukin-1 receptor accessory protein-like 1 n=1 Tax=Esox lucius TaxID=8010 RepID=A0AAY5KQT6_ESOLU